MGLMRSASSSSEAAWLTGGGEAAFVSAAGVGSSGALSAGFASTSASTAASTPASSSGSAAGSAGTGACAGSVAWWPFPFSSTSGVGSERGTLPLEGRETRLKKPI